MDDPATRRDHTRGRIWRITAKGRPLLPKPRIHGATIAEQLDLLKAYEDRTRNVYAITGGFYAIGMSYHKDRIKNPPASWKDLWRPEYAGRVTA